MFAVVAVLVLIFVFVVWYAVMQWPVFYTLDATMDSYDYISNEMGWTDAATVDNTFITLGYLFIACPIGGILLFFLYLFAVAHKKEFDIS